MVTKRIIQFILAFALLVTSLTSTNGVSAWSGCASTITVQWGDTLSGIAALCGTTAEAIRGANPGLGWWVYAGQVLCIPTGYTTDYAYYPTQNYTPSYGSTYTVQWGDTFGIIAARFGVSVSDLLAVNPQVWNASLIYSGQVIYLPTFTPVYYTVQYGDTLRIIADNHGTSVYNLKSLNPSIYDANLIYPGQIIRIW